MKRTSTWKQLERDSAKELGGERVSRGADFGVEDVDVTIEDFPSFKVDTKRYKKFSVYSLYESVKSKYCKDKNDEPILILRQHGKHTKLAVIDLDLLAKFMNFVREKGAQNEFN